MIVWEVEWQINDRPKELALCATEASAKELVVKLTEAGSFLGVLWESAPIYCEREVKP